MDHALPPVTGRARRPMLMALVFGIFLVLIGVTASALVAVASTHLSSTVLNATVARDRDLIEFFVDGNLRASDLSATGPSMARATQLRGQMETLASDDGITAMALRDRHGEIVVAGGPDVAELPTAGTQPHVVAALGGEPRAELTTEPDSTGVLEEHLPILSDGEVLGVVSLRRDATELLAGLDAARRDVMIVTLAAALVLAAILYFVFRAAQARITRQQTQLVETTRRDALTGMLNHGATVAHLTDAVDAARGTARQIAVALVDVDNFRLFNDTHGHEAGDEVLRLVAGLVTDLEAAGGHAARYGPDEFIVVYTDRPVADVQSTAIALQVAMREVGMRFAGSEELPVSVSIGIAAFPEHAASVTDLLSEASVALAEAKASGGDSVAIARRDEKEKEKEATGSFDVLQGLVIAVDTKDRYTKRHSEDVARYAVFLARQLGFDDEMLDMIHLAGLLHDIGKIGIPDALLRKPGKLTAQEFAVFQQHVALGDAIVRDVPHVELVRSGIRHHHERWDGGGYLEGLEGDGIPIIGRVLAVADAFSAMTTTRPYRKALTIEEALKRLEDAAGTQLQEELVTCFITGIETVADAPLPGERTTGLWQPGRKVA